jgi:eukaryotic-like serine/threonine-protein kinase
VTFTAAGHYRLVREIGSRGKVHVFQGVDTKTGDSVLVRAMQVDTDEDIDGFLRFQQEGAVLTTLTHPNLWHIYSTFLEGQTGYMIMEFVEGRPLTDILKVERLDPARIKRIAQQIAEALVYAHSKSIVHRDINPDNIVVAAHDVVKVRAMSEMGMARILRPGSDATSVTGMTVGRPTYLAPEQINEQPIDSRVDVYSLGAVMYHMVTGRPPYNGKDSITIAMAVVRTMPPRASSLVPGLPEGWDVLLLRAMAKNPNDRFPTMVALARAIGTLSEPVIAVERDMPAQPAPSAAQTPSPALSPPGQAMVTCPRCGKVGSGVFCTGCGTRLRQPT